MFTDEHITRLLNQQPISDAPPWRDGDERAVDSFYKYACARVSQLTMAQFHAEWKHYGSGYASFVDVCFYQGKAAQGQDAPEQMGLEVLFSRLSPYFVLMEAPVPTTGSRSLPSFNGLDQLRMPNVEMLRSKDSMTYEEGYHWLLGNVDAHFDKLVSLMQSEADPVMRGKFIELLGDATNRNVVPILAAELTSPNRDIRFWAHSQLEYSEHSEANKIAEKYKEQNPNEDWY
ncbi:HEAT repeat domain-containing protein [Hahella aquimaris]|uniref:HEAT repeat domain-containing protein n=1 Tax=Hahella sp. HNIBRBA332 TaxID=3015983 RepID=UPI00273CA315|nr:HEAT repeat domain-containing protein [Hahella sp. HNIBRBA332]WLQ16758.1 HEAT repeat domain-containing protein [Hahella sp. HNIBRBA332]